MIFYFTGTGNSKFLAKQTAEVTGDKITDLNKIIKENGSLSCDDDVLVFCTPTYSWRIPPVVSKLIKSGSFKSGAKAYFLMTCGDDIGNAEKYCKSLCKKVNFEFKGVCSVVMPENYIAMFSAPDDEKAKAIIEKAVPRIEDLASEIKDGKSFDCPKVDLGGVMKSSIVNKLFFMLCVKDKQFYAKDSCTSCGLCAKLCPMNNITVTDKPQWHGNCTHCMACICHCPTEAIEYGNKSKGQPRYHLK